MEEESRKSFAQITLYNQLIKEMDDLYRVYAKNCNLSETAFWILYCIRERVSFNTVILNAEFSKSK